MGAWSHEPFGNDVACDWVYGLEESTDLSYIQRTLEQALAGEEGYLEADEGQEAVAALEVLGKLHGRSTQSDSYTEVVDDWVEQNPQEVPESLMALALRVFGVLTSDDSELMELWAADPAWKNNLDEIRDNLTSLTEMV